MRGSVVAGRMLRLSGCLGLVALMGACGGGSSGFQSSTAGGGSTLGNLLAFNSLNTPPAAKTASAAVDETPTCPDVEVLDGTSSSRVYAGAEQTNSTVKYQFSLGDVERECAHAGDQLTLKVGAEGRALLGPVGSPGSFLAPVRVAIRREKDEKAVYSKLYQVPVTIGGGDAHADFSVVSDEIAVPYLSAHGDTDYTILVGFDTKGDGKLNATPRPKTRRKG